MAPGRLAVGLGPLAAGYEVRLDEQQTRVAGLPEALRETAETAIFTALRCASRIRAGIELLTSPAAPGHEEALEACHPSGPPALVRLLGQGVWRVAEDDPDSDLYAESSDADTGIGDIAAHS